MDFFDFENARTSIPDAEITLIQEKDRSHRKTILVNRFLLVSISKFFKKVFYWHNSPKSITEEANTVKNPVEFLKNAVFARKEMVVLDVDLFSELIDSLYAKNTKEFIISKPCKDAFTIMEMCSQADINIPYLEIIKILKGESNCFKEVLLLLESIDELKEENIALLARWMNEKVDFSVFEDKTFVDKLKKYLTNNILAVWDHGTVGIYNLNDENILSSKKLDIGTIENFSFSKSHRVLALVTESGDLYFVDINDFTKSAKFFEHTGFIYQVSFSSDGNIFAISTDDRIFLYGYPSLKSLLSFGNFYKAVDKIAWDPKGDFIAVSAYDLNLQMHDIKIFEVRTGNLIHNIDLPRSSVSIKFKISKDGEIMVVVSEDELGISIFSTTNWERVVDDYKYENQIFDIDISPDGKKILINFTDVYEYSYTAGKVLVIDWENGTEILSKDHYLDGGIDAFTPDGTRILMWLEEFKTKENKDHIWWIDIKDPNLWPDTIDLPKIKRDYENLLGLEFITLSDENI